MKKPHEITTWKSIQSDQWQNLLLGNGASIALHSKFNYKTLLDVAKAHKLLPITSPIFLDILPALKDGVFRAIG